MAAGMSAAIREESGDDRLASPTCSTDAMSMLRSWSVRCLRAASCLPRRATSALLLLALLPIANAEAQTTPQAQASPSRGGAVFEGLGLTADQERQLTDLTRATRAQLSAIHARRPGANAPLAVGDQESQAGVIRAHQARVMEILTPPQRRALERRLADRASARQAHYTAEDRARAEKVRPPAPEQTERQSRERPAPPRTKPGTTGAAGGAR